MKNKVLLFCGHSSKVYAIEQCLVESKQLASWLLVSLLLDFWLLVSLPRAFSWPGSLACYLLGGMLLGCGFSWLPSWQQVFWRSSSWASFRSLDRDGSFQMHHCLWTASSWRSSLQRRGPTQSGVDCLVISAHG